MSASDWEGSCVANMLVVLIFALFSIFNAQSKGKLRCPHGISSFSCFPNSESDSDCRSQSFFYKCENGIAILKKCQNGTYNSFSQDCVHDKTTLSRHKREAEQSEEDDSFDIQDVDPLGREVHLGNIYYLHKESFHWSFLPLCLMIAFEMRAWNC